jgi:hypothetical protein
MLIFMCMLGVGARALVRPNLARGRGRVDLVLTEVRRLQPEAEVKLCSVPPRAVLSDKAGVQLLLPTHTQALRGEAQTVLSIVPGRAALPLKNCTARAADWTTARQLAEGIQAYVRVDDRLGCCLMRGRKCSGLPLPIR